MPIVNIIKRASSYILGNEELDDNLDMIYEDNEVLFCKNNVCVHPPAFARQESDILHYPGYLTVTTKTFTDQYNNAKRPTLLLTWIPNSTLRKCPSTIENNQQLNRSHHDDLKQNKFLFNIINEKNNCLDGCAGSIISYNTNPFLEPQTLISYQHSVINCSAGINGVSDNSETVSISSTSNSDKNSICNSASNEEHCIEADEEVFIMQANENDKNKLETDEERQLRNELQPLLPGETEIGKEAKLLANIGQQLSVTSVNITIASPHISNHDISPQESVISTNDPFIRSLSISSTDESSANWMTPELLAYKHNLSFPESASASPIVTRKIPLKCRRFSVDLSQMRSLRLFFNDENCTSGQLVIASRESQYKILHFHHGGLDHLAQVLHQWHGLLHNIKLAPGFLHTQSNISNMSNFITLKINLNISGQDEPNLPYRQFMVCRPEVRKSELHPEEGKVNKITTDYFYGTLLNEKGQIEDDLLLRKCVFFGGLEKSLRKMVWPFLLHCYSFNSTFEDRAALVDIRKQEYEELSRRRLYSMSPEEQAVFWRSVQCVIEKDVVRTDRGNPYFAGDDNPNIDIMKNILLNYAYYNPGMS